MPAGNSFDYAVIRLVPRVEREEFVNVGIIVFCLQERFLQARVEIDETRLLALWPGLDLEMIRRHLEALPAICAGDPSAGPIAQLSQRERFHWLVSPRSTMIQISAVHTGLCKTPEHLMENLARRYLSV
jgi:hypothetical protein